MSEQRFHIAQVNIGKIVAPLDDPIMHGFVSMLEEVNLLADKSPGFVWRLQSEEGDATGYRPYNDDRVIVNMSVWESVELLKDYVYKGLHVTVMKQRHQWFEKYDGPYMALWKIEPGHEPTIEEAKQRLDHLTIHGDTDYAFGFKRQN